MTDTSAHIDAHLAEILSTVSDPEIPVLSIMDMGVVRTASMTDSAAHITITPTYSGCPAMDVIGDDIKKALREQGIEATVELVLSPAWTTDWMSESGKQKLLAYGIAPPQGKARIDRLLFSETAVACPQCGSSKTEQISAFGSTACKSLYRCLDCREPFDYFKCH